jgi:hypothetical protein
MRQAAREIWAACPQRAVSVQTRFTFVYVHRFPPLLSSSRLPWLCLPHVGGDIDLGRFIVFEIYLNFVGLVAFNNLPFRGSVTDEPLRN